MKTIDSDTTCRTCGARLPTGPLSGLCPACLLDSSLDALASADTRPSPTESPVTASQPWRFGRYQVLEEISRGGAGVVFRARDEALRRDVALKLLRAGSLASRDDTRRLFLEARAAARLNHPNIVPVFEIGGADDAQPFLAMAYLPGGTLAQRLKQGAVSLGDAARWLAAVARAVHHAHQHGILHRDLKPGNILFDANGAPLVADFGLARMLDEDQTLTRTDAILGTPAYLAPEQAAGRAGEITTAADIHALGAMLYETLTGRPPFAEENLPALVRQIAEARPVPPRQMNPAIPYDLETICLKCLEKEPAKRYATAQALADDLLRWINNEPILARPIGAAGKLWRFCKRRPLIASLSTAILLIAALGIVGIFWQWQRATTGELKARQHQYVSDMNLAQRLWDEGNLQGARNLLSAHLPAPGEPDLRGFEWRYLHALCGQHQSLYALTNFEYSIESLAFSPDGKVLAVATGRSLQILDLLSRRELAQLHDTDPNDSIYHIAWSPRSTNLLASIGRQGIVKLWNLTTTECTLFPHDPGAGPSSCRPSIAFSPDGTLLAVGFDAPSCRCIQIWDVASRTRLRTKSTINSPLAVAFSPDGRSLVCTGGQGGNPQLCDPAALQEFTPFVPLHTALVASIAFSSDGRILASGGADNRIVLWDFTTLQPRRTLESPGVDVVAFSPDARLVASGGDDGTIRVWDVASGEKRATLRGHLGVVWGLAFTPDGTQLVSGGNDRALHVWNATPPPDPNLLLREKRSVHSLTLSPDDQKLATASGDRDWVELWNVPSRTWITNLTGHVQDAWCAAFSPDGHYLATGSSDSTVRLWDPNSLQTVAILSNLLPAGPITFSPDSRVLAVLSFTLSRPDRTKRLALWDLSSKQKLEGWDHAAPDAAAGAFSNNGRYLAVGYLDGSARLWNFRTHDKMAEFRKGFSPVRSIAFSPDDKSLAFATGEVVLLCEIDTKSIAGKLLAHTEGVWAVAFAHDGKTLASAGNDGTVKLWNLPTLQLALALRQEIGPIYAIAFSKNDSFLVGGGSEGEVRIWPATPLK